MIPAVVIGALLGVAVSLVALRCGRGRGLVVTYGVAVASFVWFTGAVVQGNRAEGMGGLPYAVGAGMLLWFVVIPAVLIVGLLEWNRRAGVVEQDRSPAKDFSGERWSPFGGTRGVAMRVGCIVILLVWARFLLGLLDVLAFLLLSLLGWTAGGRWELATRASPHRFNHSLAPWILIGPWLVAWGIVVVLA